jgi:hypothetical protein
MFKCRVTDVGYRTRALVPGTCECVNLVAKGT